MTRKKSINWLICALIGMGIIFAPAFGVAGQDKGQEETEPATVLFRPCFLAL